MRCAVWEHADLESVLHHQCTRLPTSTIDLLCEWAIVWYASILSRIKIHCDDSYCRLGALQWFPFSEIDENQLFQVISKKEHQYDYTDLYACFWFLGQIWPTLYTQLEEGNLEDRKRTIFSVNDQVVLQQSCTKNIWSRNVFSCTGQLQDFVPVTSRCWCLTEISTWTWQCESMWILPSLRLLKEENASLDRGWSP